MYKYLPAFSTFFIALTASPFLLLPAIAESSCLNYWVNPATGKEECLNLPITKKSVVEAVKPPTTPKGFEFLTESEKGEKLFIKVNQTEIIDGVLESSSTVVTKKINGKMYDTRYQVNCDRRLIYIAASSDAIVSSSSPIAVNQPGTLGYMIWNRSCTNIQIPTSTANAKKFRIVPTRCGGYRVKVVDQDYVKPRLLNPYWLGRDGYLPGLNSKKMRVNPVLSNRQNFNQTNPNYKPVQPQFESRFQGNDQISGGHQWQSCQRDYRH